VGTVVFRLEAYDPEGSPVTYGAIGADHFSVDPVSGNITLIKPLDREEKDTLKFLVSIRDRIDPEGESERDNVVEVPITFIILDLNDNPPEFQNVSIQHYHLSKIILNPRFTPSHTLIVIIFTCSSSDSL